MIEILVFNVAVAVCVILVPLFLAKRVEKAVVPLEGPGLEKLGDGEREAVAIALSYHPDALLLIDEDRGRTEARRQGIRFMGTLGVLDRAAARGLIELPLAIERLLQTNFYVTPALLKTLLDDDARRKASLDPSRTSF